MLLNSFLIKIVLHKALLCFLLYFNALKLHPNFSRKDSYFDFIKILKILQTLRQVCQVKNSVVVTCYPREIKLIHSFSNRFPKLFLDDNLFGLM